METPQGPSRSHPTAACRLLCQVPRPSGRDAAGATGPLPQSDRDKSPPQGSAPLAHPDTMRPERPVAATVPASVAPPELARLRFELLRSEPAPLPRAAPPARRILPALWLTQGTRKAKAINSVLGISRSILPWRCRVTCLQLRPNLSLSAGQVSGTSRREVPKYEWTQRMVALTRDFHVFASCIAARLSAVFFSIRHIAKAWYVRALLRLTIRHCQFCPFERCVLFVFVT